MTWHQSQAQLVCRCNEQRKQTAATQSPLAAVRVIVAQRELVRGHCFVQRM